MTDQRRHNPATCPAPARLTLIRQAPTGGKAGERSGGFCRMLFGVVPLLLAMLFVTLAPGAGFAAAQLPSAFLQGIYKHYVGTHATGVKLDSEADYKRYFTPEMTKIIVDDDAAAQKSGDVPTLDGDPFTDAQDWSIAKFKIDVDDKATDKTVAKVSFINAGTAETVTLDLVKLDGTWKIDDIHWPEDSLRGIFKK